MMTPSVSGSEAVDRVAADAHRGGLAEPGLGELQHGLVGERAGARDDPDAPGPVDVPGHDADLALARRDDAGAVGPEEPHARLVLQVALHPHHVEDGDALGDGDHEGDACVGGLEDRVGRERGRDEDGRGVGAGLPDRLLDRVEDGHLPLEARSAPPRGDAGHDLGAVGQHLLRVEAAGRAGDSLDDDAGVSIDEDAHGVPPA
jgi:hypothetical protein